MSVIIHGPMRSFGSGKNKTLQGFDCYETIRSNIVLAESFGYEVLVSLSYSSISPDIDGREEEERERERLIDKFKCRTIFFNTSGMIEPDNRNKQRLGLLNAMSHMSSVSNSDIVLVIRTDMLFPEIFWKWLKELQQTNNLLNQEEMIVSELCLEPFYIGDFLLISKVERLRKILESLVLSSSTPIHPISNCELGLSAFCGDISSFRGISPISHFWRYIKFRNAWIYFALNIGTPPREIYAQILWRGLELEEILDLNAFQFKTTGELVKIEKSYLQVLFSFNYFNSRLQKAKGKHFSLAILLEKLRYEVSHLLP